MTLIDDILGEGGLFSQRLPNYEYRPEQIAMGNAILQAMLDKNHIVVEAGTGVGKSFGYLVPAILSLNANDKPVVVSTNTINLQEQLINKDLPFLSENLGLPFNFVLAKGRSNFISLRRLSIALEKKHSLFDGEEEFEELRQISMWSANTLDGSKSNLHFNPSSKVWELVQSEADNCMGKKCPKFRDCFYFKSRQALKEADIIVANHALLFVDMQLRIAGHSLLPDFKRLIFDEAHKIESVAGEHLGFSVSRFQFNYLLMQIYNPNKDRGFFARHNLKYVIETALSNTYLSVSEFFDSALMYLNDNTDYKNNILRLRETNVVDTSPLASIRELYEKLNEALSAAENDNDQAQIQSFMEKLTSTLTTISFILFQEGSNNYVYWLERKGRFENNISLNAAPIHVAPFLEAHLFKKLDTVAMTSATISVKKNEKGFQFFNQRVGVQDPVALMAGSPFDYKRQTVIRIPENLEVAKGEAISRDAIFAIRHYVNLTQGGCLILFTSYSAMDQAFLALQHQFQRNHYKVLCQGKNLSRSQMIEEFKKDNNGVMFGTDSFWEGVDIPGEALRNVIITKLPFSVPTHPLTQAKYEYIESIGKNSFRELSLPEAVIKFKQGFGRLIRSKRDKGIVCIIDTRVLTKPYGRDFMQAIPECEIVLDNLTFSETQ